MLVGVTIVRALATTLLVFFFAFHSAAAARHVQLFSVDKQRSSAGVVSCARLRAVAGLPVANERQ